jgi:GMP synthase-like glutamine amidotransferase
VVDEAVVWAGSGTAWAGTGWGEPLAGQLAALGWRVSLVPWGDPASEHRGRTDVLHVFSGGLEAVDSGTAAMAERLDAVRAALTASREGGAAVLGVCLGAQMLAAVGAGTGPLPVASGGEAGVTTVRGHGVPDLTVPTAHVQEVPATVLTRTDVRLLWSNPVSTVQGFAIGARAVGVQFHPELTVAQSHRVTSAFRELLDVPDAPPASGDVDPSRALTTVLAAVGVARPLGALAA